MPTRKPKNPELAAAATNLAEAAQHVRQALNQKVDEIGAAVSAELGKAKQAALTKRGRARRKFDALLKKAEGRLTKATDKARRSLAKAVRDAEKTLEAAKKATRTGLTELKGIAAGKAAPAKAKAAGAKAATKKVAAKKTVTTKAPAVAAKKAPAKKAPAKKAVTVATRK